MDTNLQISMQETNELRFNRKFIDGYIRDCIKGDVDIQAKVVQGTSLIEEYMAKDYWPSKNLRIEQIKELNIPELIWEIFVGICYFQRQELFTSATAQLASRLGFSDKRDAIATMAEIVAILSDTDAFDIYKDGKQGSLYVVCRIKLPENLITFIEESLFLPPMVCTPLEITNNRTSGYLTHNESLILGKNNHHDGDLCLDVLNIMNQVPLKMDVDFLSQVEEEPTFKLDTQDKFDLWKQFKEQSYYIYSLLESQGNKFYFNHKVDKRGRIYSQGYHLNTQGTPFKKAMLEFVEEELVEL